jgi:hypothetical protein
MPRACTPTVTGGNWCRCGRRVLATAWLKLLSAGLGLGTCVEVVRLQAQLRTARQE